MSSSGFSRRDFIRLAASTATASALPAIGQAQTPPVSKPAMPGKKLRIASIGVGHRGYAAVGTFMRTEKMVALCDVDDRMMAETLVKAADAGYPDLMKVPRFKDYREMFAKMAGEIDAVSVSAPDHHHYPAALLAMQHGKHVYVEKPLTRTVGEARALKAAARKYGVITQMGNQGHATEGIRLVREWFELGLLGEVREVIAWGPAMGGRYFYRPATVPPAAGEAPPSLDWDLWLGPAAERPFAPMYQPEMWRGWWDFGSGMLGDWACHTLDAPFWALQLGAPERVEVRVSEVNPHLIPRWAVVTFHFPARGQLPPVKLTWHEGAEVRPAKPAFWDSQEPYPGRGMLMIGSKQSLFHSGRPDSPMLVPRAAMAELKRQQPRKWLPRVKGGPMAEWLSAIKDGGPLPGSNFDYAADLSQMALLGAVAMRAGQGFAWDNQAGRVTDAPELNRFIEIQAREGWRV